MAWLILICVLGLVILFIYNEGRKAQKRQIQVKQLEIQKQIKVDKELEARQKEYNKRIIAKAQATRAENKRKQTEWLAGFTEMSVKEFFELRKKNPENFTGVYILNNTTKHKYYVGQAIRIFSRVNNHFTGKGNGDVYADYKYKDNFTVRLMPLSKSGYNSLDKLEKDMIAKFRANTTGYNKTAGNN